MTPIELRITENHRNVIGRIEQAAARSGRPAASVTMVAVVKYAQWDWVRSLVTLGVCDFGESRPQQLVERAPNITQPVRWHLIGHLQRNKARKILPLVDCIHSVDTFRLLETIDRLAEEMNLKPRILLEVNISGEAAKHGFAPGELAAGWETVSACRHVDVAGLMTMARFTNDVQETRPEFRRLRELRDQLADRSALSLPELSMGMSRDFEIAIEQGATVVRIGRSLFAGLEPNAAG